EFAAPKPKGSTSTPASTVSFGAAIFGTGTCTDWRITQNTFTGSFNDQTANQIAGILLASSVSFAQPNILTTPAPSPGTVLTAGGVASTGATVGTTGGSSGASVTGDAPGFNPLAIEGAAAHNFAVRGGSVVPVLLDDAVFSANRFSGLAVAALIGAKCGAV